jgi:hypothetical protein
MPKYKLLLGAVLGWQWTEHEVLRPLTELTEAQAAQFRAYRAAVEQERCLDPLRVRQGQCAALTAAAVCIGAPQLACRVLHGLRCKKHPAPCICC